MESDDDQLTAALFEIGFMKTPNGVNRLTEFLMRRLGPQVGVSGPTALVTARQLVRICISQVGGRAALEQGVRELGTGEPAARDFIVLSRRLAGARLFDEPSTTALYTIVDRIDVAQPHLRTMAKRLGHDGDGLTLRDVLISLEYQPDESLLFAELEEIRGRYAGDDMRQELTAWIDAHVGGLSDEGKRHVRALRAAFDGPGKRAEPVAAGDVDDASWKELVRLFANRPRPASCYEAFEWSYEYAEAAPATLPATSLTGIATHLRQLSMRGDGVPPVVAFVHYLAHYVADSAWRSSLSRWVQRSRARLRLPDLPVPQPPRPRECTLVVRVTGEGGCHARFWLRDRGYETLDDADAESLAEIPAFLAAAIRHVQPPGTPNSATRILKRVEFVVPPALLHEPFDQWRIGSSAARSVPLGFRYQVTVSCPERRQCDGDAYGQWIRKWFWLDQNATSPKAIMYVRDGGYERVLGLLGAEHPVCVVIEVADADLDDAIDAIFASGVPVAVWRRRHRSCAGQDLSAELVFETVEALPPAVRELRGRAGGDSNHVGQTVTLLLDNPDEQIPEDPLDWVDEAV